MRLFEELRSQLQYKIILPFLLLTLLVALAGSAVSFLFIVGTAQERLNNQLAQVARATSDDLVSLENANLQFLREVTFAGPNVQTGAPAVADALADGDNAGLQQSLEPFFQVSTQREGIRVDRMIVFDSTGHSVIDWERVPDRAGAFKRVNHENRDISKLWFVQPILSRQSDEFGDKYAGLLDMGDQNTRYLFTVAPVVKDSQVAGGMIIATRLDTLLQELRDASSSAIVAVYQADNGNAFASTQVPASGLAALNVRRNLVPVIRDVKIAQQQGIFDTVAVNQRQYQFAYAPLQIRSSVVGLISIGLASDYVTGPWSAARGPLIALTVVLMLAIIGLGVSVARQITRPLQELVATAQAVTSGDLRRRSRVGANDEVGILARSFNDMTEHLVDLYGTVRAESGQRAAIVESIADGVVVCDPKGTILVMNRAMLALLGLKENQNRPQRFEDVPLRPLNETGTAFRTNHSSNLFSLRDRIVRVVAAPVLDDDDMRLGDVYVLQDMTTQVTIDQARTNFIATISHELRTPLTVLCGTSELLLRGLVGELNNEQHQLIDTMRKHTLTMTSLLNNVITIARLETDMLTFHLEPTRLSDMLEDVVWPIRPSLVAKGLELELRIPEDLPRVMADVEHLRNVLHQLLDNARRYTDTGSITICATLEDRFVRVDIIDTGRGIASNLSGHLFTQFSRGPDGLHSVERGFGLGLAIAKLLLERQGGTLWLEQTSECGSTFSFKLLCAHADARYSDTMLATAA